MLFFFFKKEYACLFNTVVDSAEELKSGWQVFSSSQHVCHVEMHPDSRTLAGADGSSCLPAADWRLCLADGCCCFVDFGLSSGTSRGGKQVGDGQLKLKCTLNSVGGKGGFC